MKEKIINTLEDAPKPEIYFPEFNKKQDLLKILLIIVGGLILLYLIIHIATKKDTIKDSPYIKAQIDSLAKANDSLRIKQAKLDSLSSEYQVQINNLDWKVHNINEKKTIIREYYHEKVKEPTNYTSHQLDSFFKKRYNY